MTGRSTLDPVEVVTLWIAVGESTPANGCMRVIPGTHKLSLLPQVDRPDVDSVLGSSVFRERDGGPRVLKVRPRLSVWLK